MAAGEGRRLRPITERWPKPVLRSTAAPWSRRSCGSSPREGIGSVTVVTGHLAEEVEGLLDGLGLQFVRQPSPDGSADAVRRALEAGAGLPALVTAADTVFGDGDLARVARNGLSGDRIPA